MIEDKVYTNEDIEKEVQERVDFKLNDINDVINNHIRRCELMMRDLPAQRLHKMVREEVLQDVKECFTKEARMPTPYNEMYLVRKGKQKDEAVDNVMERFEKLSRGRIDSRQREPFLRMLVNNIEKAQR